MDKIKNWKQFNEGYQLSMNDYQICPQCNNPDGWNPCTLCYGTGYITKGELITEKWYHNLLAGLMLIMPTASQAAGLNRNNIEQSSSEEVAQGINDLIEYVKTNKKEYKNHQKVIHELEQLILKYKNGKLDKNSMDEVARKFIEDAKEAQNPNISTRVIDSDELHNVDIDDSYEQISQAYSYEEIIHTQDPEEVYIDFSADNTNYVSGAYNVDTNIAVMVNDSIQKMEALGFEVEGSLIQSSTDGQGLSTRLKKDLESQGYKADNMGLSEIRNDKLRDLMIAETEIDSTKIQQNVFWSNEGDIADDMRYNRITLIMVKHQTEVTKEVKERTVTVFYKMKDLNHVKKKKSHKQFSKKKGAKLRLDPDRYQKCFFMN